MNMSGDEMRCVERSLCRKERAFYGVLDALLLAPVVAQRNFQKAGA